jgi:hypothetical protein
MAVPFRRQATHHAYRGDSASCDDHAAMPAGQRLDGTADAPAVLRTISISVTNR